MNCRPAKERLPGIHNLIGVALLIASSLALIWLLTIIAKVRNRAPRWIRAGIVSLFLILTSLLSGAVAAGVIKQYGRGVHLPAPAVEIDAG